MTKLDDLEATPLALVSGIQMVPFNGRYLPPSMVVPLISAKSYLSLERVHLGLPEITGLTRTQLERYISSWMYAKQKGLFTCDEKISFDVIYESWHALRIELTGILIKYGLWELQLCETTGAQALPERLFFRSLWLGGVLKMAVNNFPLRWPMN